MLKIFRLTDGFQIIGHAADYDENNIVINNALKVDYSRSSSSASAIFLSRYDNFADGFQIFLNKANIISSSFPTETMEDYYNQSLAFIESYTDPMIEESIVEASEFLRKSMKLDSMESDKFSIAIKGKTKKATKH